ncbi:MAG: Cof-type HAD-IIB family hydrolase [Candidatus Dormibacteria bacterium]
MSRFKLLAIDVDGTLVDSSLQITPANLEALHGAVAGGVRVVLATGRMFRSALPYAEQIGTPEPVICYQGAVVRRPDGELLREVGLDAKSARTCVDVSRRAHLHLNLYHDDNFYVEELGWGARRYSEVAQVDPTVVPDLAEVASRGSTKAVFVAPHDELAAHEEVVRRATAPAARATYSMPEFLEVIDARVSKATALHFVCDRHGISREQVIAAGDGPNDLELFEYAGLAVAPSDARPEVLAAAGATVAPPGQDGIAELVRRYLT